MNIKVLGAGCPKCRKLYAEAEKAITSSGAKADLEKVEGIEEILAMEKPFAMELIQDSLIPELIIVRNFF